MNVAVIGGGYAGMAAAVTLAERGIPVTVFESAPHLGGRARGVAYRETMLDNGLHILIGAYHETLRLIGLVNRDASDALLRLPLDWRIHERFALRAAPLPAPLNLLFGLLQADGVRWTERFAAVRFLAALRRQKFRLKEDMSVADLLARHGQGEMLCRALWRPLCISALNTPPDQASAQVLLNVMRDSLGAKRADSNLIFARVNLSALFPEPAARYVEARGGTVLTTHTVTAIDPGGNTISVEAAGKRHEFNYAICALPPHRAKAFLAGITALAEYAGMIDQFEYEPIYSVWLQYPHAVTLPHPMLGFVDGFIQWAFDRERLCSQRGLLGAVISARGTHQDLTQDELALRVHDELARAIGPLPRPLWHRVIAEKRATFACIPGLKRPPQRTPLPHFFLAGDYTASDYPATLEAAVQSGVRCGRQILASV
jgi:hydroxysqualene dehydroxylase